MCVCVCACVCVCVTVTKKPQPGLSFLPASLPAALPVCLNPDPNTLFSANTHQGMFWARHKAVNINFIKVCQLCRVDLAHEKGVVLLSTGPQHHLQPVCDCTVVCRAERADNKADSACVLGFLHEKVSLHQLPVDACALCPSAARLWIK